MERILYGDNQFFSVNHVSDEKSRERSIKFKNDYAIIKTLDYAIDASIKTFMCTTHDRIANICQHIRDNQEHYVDFKIYPCMPYAHKYANALTELGVLGTLKEYLPGNLLGSVFKGGIAYLSKDYISMMKLMIDSEMKMFTGVNTPVIFLQNVVTDLLLGLRMKDVLVFFSNYIKQTYRAEAGFITMNFPRLVAVLNSCSIQNPIICSSINKAGFRMSGGKKLYEETLRKGGFRAIAMQVLAGGALSPNDAIEYVCSLPNVESILFGASSQNNIQETASLIRKYDERLISYANQ